MKKIILVAIATLFTSAMLLAQEEAKSPSFIGITGGYSKLSGNLTKNDYADEKSGYANSNGYNIGIEGAYYFHKYIGVGGVFSQSSFYTKGIQTLSDGYKEDFAVDSTTVTVKGKYIFTNFFVGLYFSYPVIKFTLDVRVVGGLVSAKIPEFTTYLEDQTSVTFSQKSASANTFGLQAGAGVRYSIIKNLCAKINIDYYYTKPDFKITNENRVVIAGRLITEYKQPITMLCLNFGLAYQFGK